MHQQNSHGRPQVIRLGGAGGDAVKVFVKRLPADATAAYVRDLFVASGLEPAPLHVKVVVRGGGEQEYVFAICLLATPDLCRRAVDVHYLRGGPVECTPVTATTPTVSAMPTSRQEDGGGPSYSLSQHQCEMLLNHHCPLRWGTKMDVDFVKQQPRKKKKQEEEEEEEPSTPPPSPPPLQPLRMKIQVSVLGDDPNAAPVATFAVLFHPDSSTDDGDGHKELAMKAAVGKATRMAMAQVEILLLGGPYGILRKATSPSATFATS